MESREGMVISTNPLSPHWTKQLLSLWWTHFKNIYKIAIAATELSKAKTGALIVFERDIKLKDIIDTGVAIGAEISPQLIVNIFQPNTPLHDGAVVISESKVMAAACMLPLASDKNIFGANV